METAMTTKIAAIAVAAMTLGVAMTAHSDPAEAGHRWRAGIGIGLAAGALIGAAAAANAFSGPAYVVDPGYRDCRYVRRLNAWGQPRLIRVCSDD
jgi:uncharacterized membrane protein YphA (DoxX/SURF4 family)